MGEPRDCFVIMPFSGTTKAHSEDYWTRHFEDFLKPLIEADGQWRARRSTAVRGDIIKEILADLVTAPAVVADLTDANPNVYWELGVRQSFKHGTVTIADSGTKLPFDVSTKGTLFYHPANHLKMETFRQQFRFAIRDCCDAPGRPDSHVLDTLSGRGSFYELVHRDEALRRLDALAEETANNVQRLSEIADQANASQHAGAKHTRLTRLLRLSCCELLMTTRYLDQNAAFYGIIELAYDYYAAANQQLGMWQHAPAATETWLLSSREPAVKHLAELTAALVSARADIDRRP